MVELYLDLLACFHGVLLNKLVKYRDNFTFLRQAVNVRFSLCRFVRGSYAPTNTVYAV
jgi:hypothetical protein